jgi:hypothetical protein
VSDVPVRTQGELPTPNAARPDTGRAMLEMFFDHREGGAQTRFGDSGGHLVELENGVLKHTAHLQAEDADATVTLTRDT